MASQEATREPCATATNGTESDGDGWTPIAPSQTRRCSGCLCHATRFFYCADLLSCFFFSGGGATVAGIDGIVAVWLVVVYALFCTMGTTLVAHLRIVQPTTTKKKPRNELLPGQPAPSPRPPARSLPLVQPNRVLLERLRQDLVVVNVSSLEQAHVKRDMILEYHTAFPKHLRWVILEASKETHASLFLAMVQGAVESFLFGVMLGQTNDVCGLNSRIDTEDQVEVAIRFFPSVLTATMDSEFNQQNLAYWDDICPIHAAATANKSVAFVPLLAELGIELRRFRVEERGGLACLKVRSMVDMFLLTFDQIIRGHSPDDEARAATLARLREKGLIDVADIKPAIVQHLALCTDIGVCKTTLRLVIDWVPGVLAECGPFTNVMIECGFGTSLLTLYLNDTLGDLTFQRLPRNFRAFSVLVERGSVHYPSALGFLFHDTNFRLACQSFGRTPVALMAEGMVRRLLLGHGKGEGDDLAGRLRSLVVAMAANERVSLDGLYTLVRRDPIAVLSGSSSHR